MAAFQQHRIKDVGRAQIVGALRSLCPPDVRKRYRASDKASLILPVAEALVDATIVRIAEGANYSNLAPQDVTKIGTF